MAEAFVNSTSAENAASVTQLQITWTAGAAGNTLKFAATTGSNQTITLTDNNGNTIKPVGTQIFDSSGQMCACFCIEAVKAGSTIYTVAWTSASPFNGFYLEEWSGLGVLQDSKSSQNAAPGTGTDAITSTAATISALPVHVWGFCFDSSANSFPVPGTGFTDNGEVWDATVTTARSESKHLAIGATAAATFSTSTGSDDHVAIVGLFNTGAGAALGGGAASASTAAGSLSTQIPLAGAPVSASSATAALNTGSPAAFTGAASSLSSGTAALITAIRLAGAMTSASSAALDTAHITAAAASVSSAVGSILTGILLAGAPASTFSATGTLNAVQQFAAAASSASSAAATLTTFVSVTLQAPLYTGIGGILDPSFWLDSVPTAGTVVWYDPTNMTIMTDGEIVGTSNNFSAVVQFFDGTNWAFGVVVFTPFMVGPLPIVTAATGALTTAIRLVVAASSLVSATGSLNAQIKLAAAAQTVSAANAALLTQIVLSAAALDDSNASAFLSGTQQTIAGAALSASAATGFLNAQINMLGAIIDLVSAVGALSTQILAIGTAVSISSAQGTLQTGTPLVGRAQVDSAATAALLTQVRLAGIATEIVTAAGSLDSHIQFVANAVSASAASASLSTNNSIAGAAQSISSASGSLSALISMSGRAFAGVAVGGDLTTGIELLGDASDSVSAAGLLTSTGSPVGLYVVDPFFVIGARRVYYTQNFPDISPLEAVVLTFNYEDQLVSPEVLEGIISVNVQASAGVDPGLPGSLLNGVAAYDLSRSEVMQPIHAPVDGVDYYFTITAPTTNLSKVLTRFGLISCRG